MQFLVFFVLGFLVDFVSGPVASGFTSAVALIIVTSQVKDILGISMTGTTFLEQWISIFAEIKNTRTWDAVLGICCIIVLLSMRVSHPSLLLLYNTIFLSYFFVITDPCISAIWSDKQKRTRWRSTHNFPKSHQQTPMVGGNIKKRNFGHHLWRYWVHVQCERGIPVRIDRIHTSGTSGSQTATI